MIYLLHFLKKKTFKTAREEETGKIESIFVTHKQGHSHDGLNKGDISHEHARPPQS